MSKPYDLVGQVFGRLTVLRRTPSNSHGHSQWEVKCTCGTVKIVVGMWMVSGKTKSCGCWRLERNRTGQITHGETYTRLNRIWRSIKSRCLIPTQTVYRHYGGRGITICQEWQDSFVAFRDWALANGYTDELEIDRIDNDGNYEPANCQWTTRSENVKNQNRKRRRIVLDK